jgi:hypothetical protein
MRHVSANTGDNPEICPNQYQDKKLSLLVLIVTLLMLLATNVLHAQKLDGKYILLDGYSYESRPIFTISNGMFTEIANGHMGSSTIGEGSVQLKARKLTFKYLDIPNQDSSHYTVKFAPIQVARDTAILHIRVAEEGTGPAMVNVWCVDSLNTVLCKSMTDTAGYKYLSIPADKNISKVEIISLGYFIVNLPLSKFYGHLSDINIDLKTVKMLYKSAGETVYRIVSYKKDKILLKDVKSNLYTLQIFKE